MGLDDWMMTRLDGKVGGFVDMGVVVVGHNMNLFGEGVG